MRWPFPLLFQQEIRFHISFPNKIGKDRIRIPVTAFSVVPKDMPFTHFKLYSFEKSV